jgi:hypothetical protein
MGLHEDSDPLIIEEGMFLAATKLLGEFEGGEEAFDLWTATRAFSKLTYVDAHFRVQVGYGIGTEHRDAILNYVMGVHSPEDHNLYFEGIGEDMDRFKGPAADFIRSAAWTILTAYTQRYGRMGPFDGSSGFVDPRINDPG